MNDPEDQSHDGTRGRALLVDDEPSIRRDFARLLRSCRLEVDTAEDGAAAAAMLEQGKFDLIVSDIEMPNMGGLELLRAVREHDLDVPVILVTGKPGLDSAMEAVEYGAFRYLIKPLQLQEFSQTIDQAVTLHHLARAKREALQILGLEGRQLGDRASLDARFDRALEMLWIAYQPIVDLTKRQAIAYEALVRSNEPTLKSPLDLLDAAERLDRMHDLGRRIRSLVAQAADAAPAGVMLFINLHSRDLNDDELYSRDAPLSALAGRVVLEITERASLGGVSALPEKIEQLRALGFRLAVDDLGAGYAGLSTFTQIEPDFAKLDMSLVRGVDTSERKQRVIHAIHRLCQQELNIQVVTEGVETAAERDELVRLGCVLLQGYFFAKPAASFPSPRWQA